MILTDQSNKELRLLEARFFIYKSGYQDKDFPDQFGVVCVWTDGAARQSLKFPDVSTDLAALRRLVKKMNEGKAHIEHARDIIEDFLLSYSATQTETRKQVKNIFAVAIANS